MKAEAQLWIFVKKCYFAALHFDETHFEADLAESKGKISLLRQEADKSITSAFGAEDDPDLCGVREAVLFLFLKNSEDSMVILMLASYDSPQGRVDGGPSQVFLWFKTDFYGAEFQVVGLGF